MQRSFMIIIVSALYLLTGSALAQSADKIGSQPREATMGDVPASATAKITVERRGEIVLIGINRPEIQNRLDPEAYLALAKAYYDYDHDPSLRAAALFGHGPNFSRGIDVDGFKAIASSGGPPIGDGLIDPLGKKMPGLTKPLIVAVHGDTWNMAHELFLVADVRVAADDTNFGQDENTHGRFPGGGSTVRFPHEAGWANAMRYILTGDHWTAPGGLSHGNGPRGCDVSAVSPRQGNRNCEQDRSVWTARHQSVPGVGASGCRQSASRCSVRVGWATRYAVPLAGLSGRPKSGSRR
jgi:hypothetical protein